MNNVCFSRTIEIEEDAIVEHLLIVLDDIKAGHIGLAIAAIESVIDELKECESAQ